MFLSAEVCGEERARGLPTATTTELGYTTTVLVTVTAHNSIPQNLWHGCQCTAHNILTSHNQNHNRARIYNYSHRPSHNTQLSIYSPQRTNYYLQSQWQPSELQQRARSNTYNTYRTTTITVPQPPGLTGSVNTTLNTKHNCGRNRYTRLLAWNSLHIRSARNVS